MPGKASKSYGIAVARLAGLPSKTIARAREVLEKLERYELAVFSNESKIASSNTDALETAVKRSAKKQNRVANFSFRRRQ